MSYLAFVINEESKKQVMRLTELDGRVSLENLIVYNDHVTLCYKPTVHDVVTLSNKFRDASYHLTSILFCVAGIVGIVQIKDAQGQRLDTISDSFHITIGMDKGFYPVYSNEIMKQLTSLSSDMDILFSPISIPLKLEGEIELCD